MSDVSINFSLKKLSKQVTTEVARLINDVADAQVKAAQRGFIAGQDPDNTRWKRLKTATIKRKGSGRVLIDTGTLKDKIFVSDRAKSSDLVATIRPDKIPRKKGKKTSGEIGYFHQKGQGTLPERKIFPENGKIFKRSKKDYAIVVKAFQRRVIKSVR